MRATLWTLSAYLAAVCACDLLLVHPGDCPLAREACRHAVAELAKQAGQELDPALAAEVCRAAMDAAEKAAGHVPR